MLSCRKSPLDLSVTDLSVTDLSVTDYDAPCGNADGARSRAVAVKPRAFAPRHRGRVLEAVHSSREATMRRSTVATVLVAVFVSYLGIPTPLKGGGYDETDLVADVNPLIDKNRIKHQATILDPLLVNPWGIAESQASPFWVSDNGAGVSTLYVVNSTTPIAKNQNLMFVNIPAPGGPSPRNNDGKPTGAVFNLGAASGAFQISGFNASGAATQAAATFLFATEDGTIVGWNQGIFQTNPGGRPRARLGLSPRSTTPP
jgi:hypothetical protein